MRRVWTPDPAPAARSYAAPEPPAKSQVKPLTEAALKRATLPFAQRAKAEAKIERDQRMSRMTAAERAAFRQEERAAAYAAKDARKHAKARKRFSQKVKADPLVALRFDLAHLPTTAEIDGLLGDCPEVRGAWAHGSISDFIRALARLTTLARSDMDRFVATRNARDGVEDPPWLMSFMVRKLTNFWSLRTWKRSQGASCAEARRWARDRVPQWIPHSMRSEVDA